MIVAIKGKLIQSTPVTAIIEAGGLHYEVNIPLTTAEVLPKNGTEVLLHTVAIYREDSQSLFGFATIQDRDFFKTLVEKVSGIGPKTAQNMMSRMATATLRDAIASGNITLLSKCPGIGKKTAERLVLELKGTLTGASSPTNGIVGATLSSADSIVGDAVAALIALGLKPADADKYVRQAASKLGEGVSTEELVKFALSK